MKVTCKDANNALTELTVGQEYDVIEASASGNSMGSTRSMYRLRNDQGDVLCYFTSRFTDLKPGV